jgi:hypothetical protein
MPHSPHLALLITSRLAFFEVKFLASYSVELSTIRTNRTFCVFRYLFAGLRASLLI